jgi:hypothetical protein
MTLHEYALDLREKLAWGTLTPLQVANDIVNKTHNDGARLSAQEREKVLVWLRDPHYDFATGTTVLEEADNSALLRLVMQVNTILNGK